MGLVLNQSLKNTIVTYIGFAIGGINTIYFYPHFLGSTYYALTTYLLSASAIIMPLLAFGMQNTLVKFFSQCQNEKEESTFLSFVVLLPLVLSIPLLLLFLFFYGDISDYLSKVNPIVKEFLWFIPFIGICMAYFEIFYAWARVHMHSVFGNFIKEVGLRFLSLLTLVGVYYHYISPLQFIYITAFTYFLACIVTMFYAFYLKKPHFQLAIPHNVKAIAEYTFYIILSGGVATLLLDIDKLMLNQYIKIENIAYYSVATYIALVISVPSKAMYQITYPITAKLMHEEKHDELDDLYKKTSINLQIVGGYVMLCIFVNINKLYEMIPDEYGGGLWVVFLVGLSKYIDLILGNNTAIIFNTKYYRAVLFLGVVLVLLTVGLNMIFIPIYGILGSAIAILLSVILYSLAKLIFVQKRLDLYPFTKESLYSLVLTLVLFGGFYFWDFPVNGIIAIFLKSVIVSVVYVYLNYKLLISPQINEALDGVIKKIFRK